MVHAELPFVLTAKIVVVPASTLHATFFIVIFNERREKKNNEKFVIPHKINEFSIMKNISDLKKLFD